jgi:hypothetical protein
MDKLQNERMVLAQVFIARLNHNSRRNRIDLLVCPTQKTSFSSDWFRSAYETTKPRGRAINREPWLKEDVRQSLESALQKHFEKLNVIETKAAFDDWQEVCLTLIEEQTRIDNEAFWSFGRSRKLLNILLKYFYACSYGLGEINVTTRPDHAWVARLSKYFHAPVDRGTLQHVVACSEEARTSLVRCNKLISWWGDMNEQDYALVQRILGTQSVSESVDRVHYEMKYIW